MKITKKILEEAVILDFKTYEVIAILKITETEMVSEIKRTQWWLPEEKGLWVGVG